MTLTELRYIIAVANERHFGRAAEKCFVSQPTLSVAVRKLEDELNVTLFERGGGDIRVTPIGEAVVAQAQRTLEDAQTIKEIARSGQDQLSSILRIGAIHTIGPYLFPQLIPAMHRHAPKMPLQVEENYTADLARRLRQGEVDVVILSLPFEEAGIETRTLYEEPFVVVMPTGHNWLQHHAIAPEHLADENVLLLGAGHCFRDQVLQVCPACNRSAVSEDHLQATLEGSSLETIRHMVATGTGVTVLPQSAAGLDRYSESMLDSRPFTTPVKRTVALAWRRSFPRPQALDVIHTAIRECRLAGVEHLNNDA